tara:strand:- start:3225 stop:3662 length:438 start_codon:yes stop_codon:yes gene_type:complete
MFKKIEAVAPPTRNVGQTDGSYGVIYKGKNNTFNLCISKGLLTSAKLVIGDRASMYLGEDGKGSKWIVIEANNNGYTIVTAGANSKGENASKKGTFDRGVMKTSQIDNFLTKYFSERFVWSDDKAETKIGSIAFPLEKEKTWFKR